MSATCRLVPYGNHTRDLAELVGEEISVVGRFKSVGSYGDTGDVLIYCVKLIDVTNRNSKQSYLRSNNGKSYRGARIEIKSEEGARYG